MSKSSNGEKNTRSPKIKLGVLPDALGYMLRRAQVAVFNEFMTSFSEMDIRPYQFGILTVIAENPGLKQSQISEALDIKRTNLVAMLDTLEDRELIRRDSAPNDRRSHSLFLTDDGAKFYKKMLKVHQQMELRLTEIPRMNNRDELISMLKALISHLTV